MAAARHVRIALFFHPKLNTTASSPSPGTQSLKRCALSQETELPGTHPIPTIGLLPIFPPAPTPTPPLHATQHFVQEALFIGFAMNKALSIVHHLYFCTVPFARRKVRATGLGCKVFGWLGLLAGECS